jgi:hypothetical protein
MPSTTKPSVKKDGEQRNLWSAQHTPTYNETGKEGKGNRKIISPVRSLLSGKKGEGDSIPAVMVVVRAGGASGRGEVYEQHPDFVWPCLSRLTFALAPGVDVAESINFFLISLYHQFQGPNTPDRPKDQTEKEREGGVVT